VHRSDENVSQSMWPSSWWGQRKTTVQSRPVSCMQISRGDSDIARAVGLSGFPEISSFEHIGTFEEPNISRKCL
jgi:hypothetical protein